jgi:hypothetical protein
LRIKLDEVVLDASNIKDGVSVQRLRQSVASFSNMFATELVAWLLARIPNDNRESFRKQVSQEQSRLQEETREWCRRCILGPEMQVTWTFRQGGSGLRLTNEPALEDANSAEIVLQGVHARFVLELLRVSLEKKA